MLTIYNIYHIRPDCSNPCCNGKTPPEGHFVGNVLANFNSTARTIGAKEFNIPPGDIRVQTDIDLTNKIANRGRTTRLREYMERYQIRV